MSAFEMLITCPSRSMQRANKICARKKQDAGDFVKEKKRKCEKTFRRSRNRLYCFWGREINDLKEILARSEERVRCFETNKILLRNAISRDHSREKKIGNTNSRFEESSVKHRRF
eukprot:UN14560